MVRGLLWGAAMRPTLFAATLFLIGCGTVPPSGDPPDAADDDGPDADVTPDADGDAPETTITQAPPAVDNSTDVSFEFESDDPDATFECRLDDGDFAACASPHPVSGLGDGDHAFAVRALDAAGNPDPTPAEHAWSIDTSTPDTAIDSGPTGAVPVTSATFTFSSPDAGAGASFDCALDGAAFAACT
jgi:hypothetical protein